ncbi:MAG: tRNA dimethylallyltransferase [Gaiellaceae bacterium]|nr:tRNA dimethylallyltransferase [Gaiellaceae bacterium]
MRYVLLPVPLLYNAGDNGLVTVIGIFGPTASGKSAVAEAVAERLPAELVSADAMQVYRDLPILTNQSAYPTRLVGIWPLEHEASVGAYAPLAHAAIDEILAAGKTPVVVGGTGLYLRAALAELELPPAPAPGVRARWSRHYDEVGAAVADAELGERDPVSAAAIHPNDRRRVIRALELVEVGSSLAPSRDRLWTGATRHPTVVVGLDVPKDVLNHRIGSRTRAMFAAGVQEEVRAALARKISPTARKTMGIDEVANLPDELAQAALVTRTRRYAAYQRKWMRRVPGIVMVDGDRPPGVIADDIVALARTRERLPGQ